MMHLSFRQYSFILLLSSLFSCADHSNTTSLEKGSREQTTRSDADGKLSLSKRDEASAAHPVQLQYEACMEQHMSTSDLIRCTEKAYSAWESEIKNNYDTLLTLLDDQGRRNLERSQQAWLEYLEIERKTSNDIYNCYMGGTLHRAAANMQLLEVVSSRAQLLSNMLMYVTQGN
mgnify:CR=1 FL=1